MRPKAPLREFARLLGWNGLELFLHHSKHYGILPSYQTPDVKFNLQINENPIGQTRQYQATVKADRYRITAIKWIPFELFDDQSEFESEAARILPSVSRANWKSKAWRNARLLQPGLILPKSKKKLRGRRRKNHEGLACQIQLA